MLTIPELPAGSKIEITPTAEGFQLSWKVPGGGCARYPIAAFLLFWLGCWTVGGLFAIGKFVESLREGTGIAWFLLFWLGGWLFGEASALFFLYHLIRGGKPETLELGYDALTHAPGLSLAAGAFSGASEKRAPDLASLLWSRKEIVARRSEISDVVLERVGEHQRLTIDVGTDRIEIGRHLHEPEREWLASVVRAWWEAR